MKRIQLILIAIIIGFSVIILINYISISYLSKSRIINNINNIKNNNTILLLGTSKLMENGNDNLFFNNRIDALVHLYSENKIKKIIISGDSSDINYDEANLMYEDLLDKGITDSIFVLHKKGYSTIESIRYCKQNRFDTILIVSQKFHNERCIMLAEHFGIEAKAYNAKPVYTNYGIRVEIREFFARIKLSLELLFLN